MEPNGYLPQFFNPTLLRLVDARSYPFLTLDFAGVHSSFPSCRFYHSNGVVHGPARPIVYSASAPLLCEPGLPRGPGPVDFRVSKVTLLRPGHALTWTRITLPKATPHPCCCATVLPPVSSQLWTCQGCSKSADGGGHRGECGSIAELQAITDLTLK